VWIFTKVGFFSLVQSPQDADRLLVQARDRGEVGVFVRLLDEVAGEKHEAKQVGDSPCPFLVVAQRNVVAQVLARLATEIDYTQFSRVVHFDFGVAPDYFFWVAGGGLQVLRVNPE